MEFLIFMTEIWFQRSEISFPSTRMFCFAFITTKLHTDTTKLFSPCVSPENSSLVLQVSLNLQVWYKISTSLLGFRLHISTSVTRRFNARWITLVYTLFDCPVTRLYDCHLKTSYNVSSPSRRGAGWNLSVDRRHQRYPLPTAMNGVPLDDVGCPTKSSPRQTRRDKWYTPVHICIPRDVCILGTQMQRWLSSFVLWTYH